MYIEKVTVTTYSLNIFKKSCASRFSIFYPTTFYTFCDCTIYSSAMREKTKTMNTDPTS